MHLQGFKASKAAAAAASAGTGGAPAPAATEGGKEDKTQMGAPPPDPAQPKTSPQVVFFAVSHQLSEGVGHYRLSLLVTRPFNIPYEMPQCSSIAFD